MSTVQSERGITFVSNVNAFPISAHSNVSRRGRVHWEELTSVFWKRNSLRRTFRIWKNDAQAGLGMESAVKWLKASYTIGAIADGLTGILMLLPERMGEVEFRYPMGLGAALMFGWTALLIWAYQRPMERKGILLLTIFPVISGLVGTGIWAVAAGHLPMQRIVPSTILGIALIIFMGFSYRKAAVAAKQGIP